MDDGQVRSERPHSGPRRISIDLACLHARLTRPTRSARCLPFQSTAGKTAPASINHHTHALGLLSHDHCFPILENIAICAMAPLISPIYFYRNDGKPYFTLPYPSNRRLPCLRGHACSRVSRARTILESRMRTLYSIAAPSRKAAQLSQANRSAAALQPKAVRPSPYPLQPSTRSLLPILQRLVHIRSFRMLPMLVVQKNCPIM
jgi:hypothetical protein